MKFDISCTMGRAKDSMSMHAGYKQRLKIGVGVLHTFFVRLVKEGKMSVEQLLAMTTGGSSNAGSSDSASGGGELLFASAMPARAGPENATKLWNTAIDKVVPYLPKSVFPYVIALGVPVVASGCNERREDNRREQYEIKLNAARAEQTRLHRQFRVDMDAARAPPMSQTAFKGAWTNHGGGSAKNIADSLQVASPVSRWFLDGGVDFNGGMTNWNITTYAAKAQDAEVERIKQRLLGLE